ncbi:hypothetical protein C8R44DRAFT_904363, partial [Mycena epipterygia]
MSTKDLTVIAMERSEPSRLDYSCEVSQYLSEYLGFLNETSKNDKTPARRHDHGIVASKVVEGSMHQDQYLEFLEYQVVCSLSFVHNSHHNKPSVTIVLPVSWSSERPRHGQCVHPPW